MGYHDNKSYGFLITALLCACVRALVHARSLTSTPLPTTRYFHFNVEWKEVTRLCHTKPILTVNGMYPGPNIAVYEGDEVVIRVTNRVASNTTIHWHGIKQLRTGWADGPAYITQCPIRSNQSYSYRFKVIDQRGTFWWHAHISWQRASVHGVFIIYPRHQYPFSIQIKEDIPIILGEWWNGGVEAVEADIMRYGGGPNVSDAFTINGLPGPLYPCSTKDTFVKYLEHGKTYMLRVINAALNSELFFGVAHHTLTVVEIDGVYVKPFPTPAVVIAPGQTTNVLITANQISPTGTFSMAARPYVTAIVPFDESSTVGFIHYTENTKKSNTPHKKILQHPSTHPPHLSLDYLPPFHDTAFNNKFSNKLRSLASAQFPCKVPKTVDKRVFLTLSLNLQDCPSHRKCKGLLGKRFFASMNNQSFIRPIVSILESRYRNLQNSPISLDFPEKPPHSFNYTGPNSLFDTNMNTRFGSKVMVVPYGTRLEFVLQDTSFINVENHPIHIHGHNFFIVGSGTGNFDYKKDPQKFNLVDPPERNTVAVPSGGWAVIRLRADNPGVWFMHCHLEVHTSWGLAMAFVVENGPKPCQSILPPPKDLPPC
ncbi:hypothetical protein MRB53_036076 [Persea americana]|uniref:Uncharacterized protein n=1 Tax=Persea americana TaxID=3435 RepID=A0ACC2K6F3_PERAE|nr:hypothetical protein MRB53_036076 [Persea americana]